MGTRARFAIAKTSSTTAFCSESELVTASTLLTSVVYVSVIDTSCAKRIVAPPTLKTRSSLRARSSAVLSSPLSDLSTLSICRCALRGRTTMSMRNEAAMLRVRVAATVAGAWFLGRLLGLLLEPGAVDHGEEEAEVVDDFPLESSPLKVPHHGWQWDRAHRHP